MQRFALTFALFVVQPVTAQSDMSAGARAYLNSALQILEENFAHRENIDWERLRREALSQAAGAEEPVDTYQAIRFALRQLGDDHSFLQLTPALMRAESARRNLTTAIAPPSTGKRPSPFRDRRTPAGALIGDGAPLIGRVVIPSFSGAELDQFATDLQRLIAEIAAKAPCGWIVDLRGNGGGNMWPMLAGVGPILGEGEAGAFLANGTKSRWFYEAGVAGTRSVEKTVPRARSQGPQVNLPGGLSVAVLIDAGTGSSGEAIAVAFKGRPMTRFFGETTYGVANSTFPFPLTDGAQLFLVVAVDIDRNGIEYPNGVSPDVMLVAGDDPVHDDIVVGVAARWLLEQPTCR